MSEHASLGQYVVWGALQGTLCFKQEVLNVDLIGHTESMPQHGSRECCEAGSSGYM